MFLLMSDEVSLDFMARQLERALDRLGSVERGLGALREEMQGVCDRVDAVVMSSLRLERGQASAGEQPQWSLTQAQAALAAEAVDYIEAGRATADLIGSRE
jgi:hypothetical protein